MWWILHISNHNIKKIKKNAEKLKKGVDKWVSFCYNKSCVEREQTLAKRAILENDTAKKVNQEQKNSQILRE